MTDDRRDDRGPDDFEARLREGLHASARQVTPDPQTWWRVQRRLRRRRTAVRGGALALAGALTAVLAVTVIPGDDDARVELRGVATDPAPTVESDVDPSAPAVPPPTTTGSAGAMVYSDGAAIHVADLQGAIVWTPVEEEARGPITDVVVRPGGTVDDFAAVYRVDPVGDGRDCGELYWLRIVDAEVDGAGSLPGSHGDGGPGCQSAPAFADDGSAAAWLRTPTEGAATELDVVDWADEGPLQGTPVSAAVQLDTLTDPAPVEWTVAPPGGDTEGTGALSVRATTADGEGLFTFPTVRTADGTVSVPPIEPAPDTITPPAPYTRLLDADDGWVLGRPVQPEEYPESPPADQQLLFGRADATHAPHPSSILSWEPGQPLSFDALGGTAVVAAGGHAEVVTDGDDGGRSGVGFDDRTIVSAALLAGEPPTAVPTLPAPASETAPPATPAPTVTAPPSPPPTATPTPTSSEPVKDPPPAMAPEATRATADAIRAAAQAGDWDAIDALIPDGGFTSSYGGTTDHVAYYRSLDEDVLGTLADLLAGTPAPVPDTDLWAWPQAYVEEDGYLGWRVGITAEGTWRYFVAGD